MTNSIIVSTPPHIKSKRTTRGIMLDVIISLLPTVIMAIVYYRVYALVLLFVSVISAVLSEFIYYFFTNHGYKNKFGNAINVCKQWLHQFDFTSIITGIILALILPANTKWYEIMIGAVFAIIIVKMLFGGTGKNLVNPAAIGRAVLFISFSISAGVVLAEDGSLITGATFLSGNLLQGNTDNTTLLQLFLGNGIASAAIGETCKAAILLGYLYLCLRNVIKWWQPLLYVGLSGFLSVCLAATTEGATFDISLFPYYILSGGLLFGAVFMATDYVTSPKGIYGQIVYYILLAILTSLLRHFTKIEVVSFAILLANLVVPLIDTYIYRKPFGYVHTKNGGNVK